MERFQLIKRSSFFRSIGLLRGVLFLDFVSFILLLPILRLFSPVPSRQLLDQVAKPSDLGLELLILALIVVDFHLVALLVGEVNALLVISVDGQGSEVAEVELDDVVVRPSDYFEIVDGDSFFAVDQGIRFPCPFAHFLHFEEGVFGDEERLEVKQSDQFFIILVVLGDLQLHRFGPFFDNEVVLLPEFKNVGRPFALVETAHHAVRKQISERALELETLSDIDE